jgi:serine/threonine-protein kinase
MAPEQILASHDVAPSADLYAVGAILHRAVTGKNVFGEVHGMSLARIKLTEEPPITSTHRTDRVARGFDELIMRALARAPKDRHESADEMLADLCLLRDVARNDAAAASIPPPALPAAPAVPRSMPPPPRASVPPPAMIRRPKWVPRVALAALIALAIGFMFLGRDTFARSAPVAEPCRVVSRHIEGPDETGVRHTSFSISCKER